MKPIEIRHVDTTFERERLARPFGFKGGYLSELWQSVALLESAAGHRAVGLGTQSVLWSDPAVFARHTEAGANALLYAVTEQALQHLRGATFTDPVALLDELLEAAYPYARRITRHEQLRKTFVLNALVGLDCAAWLLYAQANGLEDFDAMIPPAYRPALAHRHTQVAGIPVVSYGASAEAVAAAMEQGALLIKVKLGHPGTPREMLDQDKQLLSTVHRVLGPRRTAHTADGRLRYYLDVNGRYPEKETLERLLDHARRIGALDRILLVEEPFPERAEIDVSGLGVRVAADESAHTDADTLRRIEMGYGAVALKPVAKTFSMTLKIARTAHAHGIPCFCADLTVNPILVDWNKSVAARLAPLPGLRVGLLETNGHQNYARWEAMEGFHPHPGASWARPREGLFRLGDDFYARSGGLFDMSPHYLGLVRPAEG